jgi:hypothetical protein
MSVRHGSERLYLRVRDRNRTHHTGWEKMGKRNCCDRASRRILDTNSTCCLRLPHRGPRLMNGYDRGGVSNLLVHKHAAHTSPSMLLARNG